MSKKKWHTPILHRKVHRSVRMLFIGAGLFAVCMILIVTALTQQ